jgi:hypothetical protein
MTTTRAPLRDPFSSTDAGQDATAGRAISPEIFHQGHRSHFWRHFLEMNVAMLVGMAVGGMVFGRILVAFGTTITETRLQYPELAVLVMGFNMTVPMVAWMRYRGHGWRSSAEMAAVMFVPCIPIMVLLRSNIIAFASVCGLYCASMAAAMLIVMFVRRSEYAM